MRNLLVLLDIMVFPVPCIMDGATVNEHHVLCNLKQMNVIINQGHYLLPDPQAIIKLP